MPDLNYDHIRDGDQLSRFCEEISQAAVITFDTEFVSEDSYRPHLCLIQVAIPGKLAVIDPLTVEDVDPFWKVLAEPGHATIVHAGREEFRFCLHAINRRPAGWFDTQMAAAFVGMEFPAAYNTLVARLLDKSLPKGETRTDWRRRPLSSRQLDYALQDVMYLEPIATLLQERIEQLGRAEWLSEELARWQDQVEGYDKEERWQRVSGISGLSRRSLAIVRELWRWRDAEAQRRDRPAKHLLRDDLIVELARRKTSDLKRIRAVRGLDRGHFKRHIPEFSECIQRALTLPETECPHLPRRPRANSPQFTLLGQFMNVVLSSTCRTANLAPTLVGTVQDVRDLLAYYLQTGDSSGRDVPSLAEGWRAQIVGRVMADVLEGNLAVRVKEPLSDQPLEIVQLPHDASRNVDSR